MKQAVITTGGKQYLVTEGNRIKVEKLPGSAGKAVRFSQVLLAVNGDAVAVGVPYVTGVRVDGKIVRHGRAKKVVGVKMKAKKRSRKYFGHKQHFTEVEITTISLVKGK